MRLARQNILMLIIVMLSLGHLNTLSAQNYRILPTTPDITSDGTKIVFVDDVSSDIYVVEIATQEEINLTGHWDSRDVFPQWSPSDQQIAFISDRSGVAELWLMDADGNNPINLTEGIPGEKGRFYQWSPDGRKIVFSSATNPNLPNSPDTLWTIDLASLETNAVTPPIQAFFDLPSWSPSGDYLAFNAVQNNLAQIWLYSIEENSYEPILQGRNHYIAPTWGTDDTTIFFFTTCRTGLRFDIGVYSLDSKETQLLTLGSNQCEAILGFLHWNEGNNTLIFPSLAEDYHMGISQVDLSGEVTVLMDDNTKDYTFMAIASNSNRWVVSISSEEGQYLQVINSDNWDDQQIITFE